MSNPMEVKELFAKGFNCAQSVLYVYGKSYFKENASALKLASAFGAGVSYRGELCGAVSGALMVIGLHYGYSALTMDPSQEKIFKVSKEFIDVFEKQNGSIVCNRLLKSEISTPEGLMAARQNGAFKNCPLLVVSASEILDSLMQKYPSE